MLVCNHLYYLELLWTKGLFIPQTETYPKTRLFHLSLDKGT